MGSILWSVAYYCVDKNSLSDRFGMILRQMTQKGKYLLSEQCRILRRRFDNMRCAEGPEAILYGV